MGGIVNLELIKQVLSIRDAGSFLITFHKPIHLKNNNKSLNESE